MAVKYIVCDKCEKCKHKCKFSLHEDLKTSSILCKKYEKK